MPKILTFTVEVSDEQFNNFIERMTGDAKPVLDADDDDAGPVNASAPSLDSAGIPWIESVHASTKGTTNDGKWRGKKGVTPDERARVESEWKASTGLAPAPAPGMPGIGGGMPGMPGLAPTPAPVSYDQVIGKYQELAGAGKITPDHLGPIYAAAGVTDVNTLMTDETQRAKVMAELVKFG